MSSIAAASPATAPARTAVSSRRPVQRKKNTISAAAPSTTP
jgi:hypothetical protein